MKILFPDDGFGRCLEAFDFSNERKTELAVS